MSNSVTADGSDREGRAKRPDPAPGRLCLDTLVMERLAGQSSSRRVIGALSLGRSNAIPTSHGLGRGRVEGGAVLSRWIGLRSWHLPCPLAAAAPQRAPCLLALPIATAEASRADATLR